MGHMKNYKQLVKELPAKKVVFAFGRYQPPTVGHGLLVTAVKHIAQKQGADHVIYASRSQDKKSNPLSVDRKVYYLKRMFPATNFIAANEHVRTFIEAVKDLNKKYKNIIMVAGSDRVAEYQKLLNKYNGKDFNYDTIEVVSAGERDPDAEGASGMSGTKMREAAKKGDFTSFKKGLPSTLSTQDAKRLMNELREAMGVEAIKEKVEFQKDEIREAYHRGDIYNVGDVVESNGELYKIEKRGSNHLLLRESSGGLVNKWLQDVEQTDKEFVLEGTLQEMKFQPADKIKVARVIAQALGLEDVEKSSNPEQLINNALRKVRSKPMRPEYISVLHKMLGTATEAGIKFDNKLVPIQVEKVEEETINELKKETLKSYVAKSLGSKSAADFQRGVKMAQGTDGEEELRKKSEKRSEGIHTAIKKLTKEELEEAAYWKNKSWQKKMADAAKKERQAREKKETEQVKEELEEAVHVSHERYIRSHSKTASGKGQWAFTHKRMGDVDYHKDNEFHKATGSFSDAKKSAKMWAKKHGHSTVYVMEETQIDEGRMGELHDTISRHLDKHISDFKSGHTGMDQFGSKVLAAHKAVAKEHGLEHKHAVKHVNDYVDSKLNECLEEGQDYSVTVTHYADGKHTEHEYTVKNANDRRHAKHIAMQRHGKKIGTLKQGEQYGSSNTQVKELNKESYKEISDLLEQIATATLTGKNPEKLKQKLRTLRDPKDQPNQSDVEAEVNPTNAAPAIGHTLVAPHETTAIRKMKVKYQTEEVELNEDQATAEYKTKTYYDNATGETKTRKIRPHRVTFSASKKGGEPEVDQPGEDLKNEAYLREEDEDDKDLEHDNVSTESDLEDMTNEIKDIDDILDAYDEDELSIVDDETGEEVEVKDEDDEVNEETLMEVLSRAERMRAKIRFAKTKAKRERKLKIVLKSRSNTSAINARSRRLAIKLMKQRIAKKPLNKLSVSEKERIEKIIQRRKSVVNRLAMKLVPRIKKIENERLTHKAYTK